MTSSSNELAIDLRHVSKTYARRVHALRGIEMRVRGGEVFGLLGPNGAGKSTLVKIMMTVVRPTRAEGTLLGRPLGHKPTLTRIGYLPENHRFPGYLTARQVLDFYAAMAKVDRTTRRRRAVELLELVGLSRRADSRVGTYSKGMQQRLALAQAMMNDPQLVVLDEPTDGLDPVGRREVRELLGQLRRQGKTVFINSHLLGEVERLCDRVAILVDGRVVRQGTIDDLTAGNEHYEIELHGTPGGNLRKAVRVALPLEKTKTASGESLEFDGTTVRIGTGDPAVVQPILDALRGRDLVIRSVRPIRQSLEDFFVKAVSDVQTAEFVEPLPEKGAPA